MVFVKGTLVGGATDVMRLIDFAREFQLEANVVDKDNALGWLKLARRLGSLYSSGEQHPQ